MKIELSHDTLAKRVYERASANDRMRLRVLNLVKVKYQLYEVDQALLTSDEVKAIAPFEEELTLTNEEQIFLRNSKIRAHRILITFIVGAGIATFLAVGILSWFLNYHVANNEKLAASNKMHMQSEIELAETNNYLESKLAELRTKDSIHTILLDSIGYSENVIKMTTRELQDALTELHLANEQLEASKRALELERDKLRQDQKGLKQELTKQVKIANEVYRTRAKLSAIDQSQRLSQQAQKLLQSKNPTNKQYKEAFQLARYAWGLSKNNSQAMDVLNKINTDKLKNSGGSGFLSGERPKNTYTYSSIERIIKKIDDRYKYGKISETDIKRLLR